MWVFTSSVFVSCGAAASDWAACVWISCRMRSGAGSSSWRRSGSGKRRSRPSSSWRRSGGGGKRSASGGRRRRRSVSPWPPSLQNADTFTRSPLQSLQTRGVNAPSLLSSRFVLDERRSSRFNQEHLYDVLMIHQLIADLHLHLDQEMIVIS